jgi:hypothetical protein
MEKGVKLFEVIFDGNYLYYNDRLANTYRQLAMLYLLKGDRESAVDCVEKMSHYAIEFDSLPDSNKYSSVLLNTIEYVSDKPEGVESLTLCEKLVRGRFSNRIWAPIRNNERFVAAIEAMSTFVKA